MASSVHSRPVARAARSAEDILAGVDFLSMFMKSAEEYPSNTHVTTTSHSFDTTTLTPSDLDRTTLPDTTTPPSTTSEPPVETTLVDTEPPTKVLFLKDSPSAIISQAKREDFSVDEAEPITVSVDAKVKRKSEDLLAIGANPDYIAQQHARIHSHREGLTPYNQPYHSRNPSSRGRAVSYSTVIQSLPSWKTPDESNTQEKNTKFSSVDYDYTESYQDYQTNDKKNRTIASVAESKDYFVTRKYNPEDFNDSSDKNSRPNIKKPYEHERNWGIPEKNYEISESNQQQPTVYGRPEENYEVDESISVMTNGRVHGIQSDSQHRGSEKPLQMKVGQEPVKPDDNQKIGYVVEGRNYRKYRVEERTSDGFIVGEYGVVSNNDGSLRGVRYTADGTINPRVIYDALMKFLAL